MKAALLRRRGRREGPPRADPGRDGRRRLQQARQHMLEALSMYSDELMELLLSEEEVPEELIHRGGARRGAAAKKSRRCSWARPTATRACSRCWTPSSATCPRRWTGRSTRRDYDAPGSASRSCSRIPHKPFVGMAFKIVDDPYGQLTFMRIYQGSDREGRAVLQSADRPQGAVQPHRADARRQARGSRRGRGGRHRGRDGHRLRQRRHVRRRSPSTARSRTCSCPSR